jgi:hypothetical protein
MVLNMTDEQFRVFRGMVVTGPLAGLCRCDPPLPHMGSTYEIRKSERTKSTSCPFCEPIETDDWNAVLQEHGGERV